MNVLGVNNEAVKAKHMKDRVLVTHDPELFPPLQRAGIRQRNRNINEGMELCEHCDGTGNVCTFRVVTCGYCEGTGVKQ